MRISLIILFGLAFKYGTAQKLDVNYRTSIDSIEKLHYLVFIDNSTCKLIYANRNHGDAMLRQQRNVNLTYQVFQDTITFIGSKLDSTNLTIGRLLKSKFLVTGDRQIFDVISGYTYVDKKLISDKYDIYSFDGKIYKQKRGKTDGYGLIRRSYKGNWRLKKRLKQINKDNFEITLLRGKGAYDKYGVIGMNGVIEIMKKK